MADQARSSGWYVIGFTRAATRVARMRCGSWQRSVQFRVDPMRRQTIHIDPAQRQRQCVKSLIAWCRGRRESVCINQGGARMDDTPPRYQPEAR